MIIFNDSISRFTGAAFKAFAEAYLCSLVTASAKKKCKELNSWES